MHRSLRTWTPFQTGAVLAGVFLALLTPSAAGAGAAHRPAAAAVIHAVGAENEYANVISQIGGRYVSATGIMDNPNVDPHTFESSTQTAAEVADASLVVQNGLGYDTFMNKLEAASPRKGRIVLTVASLVGAGPQTPNPHLWYKPSTMPRVAAAIATALARLEPAHTAYFRTNAARFTRSLAVWTRAIARLKAAYKGQGAAVTEPVADYLLKAAGLAIRTPWTFQAAVMNGTDPSPQDAGIQDSLLRDGKVKVLVYNQQAVDATTTPLIALAKARHIPIVGVYETMPPHMSYQEWMLAETTAIFRALRDHRSTVTVR